jgi:hypothetical protein
MASEPGTAGAELHGVVTKVHACLVEQCADDRSTLLEAQLRFGRR